MPEWCGSFVNPGGTHTANTSTDSKQPSFYQPGQGHCKDASMDHNLLLISAQPILITATTSQRHNKPKSQQGRQNLAGSMQLLVTPQQPSCRWSETVTPTASPTHAQRLWMAIRRPPQPVCTFLCKRAQTWTTCKSSYAMPASQYVCVWLTRAPLRVMSRPHRVTAEPAQARKYLGASRSGDEAATTVVRVVVVRVVVVRGRNKACHELCGGFCVLKMRERNCACLAGSQASRPAWRQAALNWGTAHVRASCKKARGTN